MGTSHGDTIGVVTGWLEPAYHLRVLRGIRHAAREAGLGVVAFPAAANEGGRPWYPTECFDARTIGGVIVLPSVLSLPQEPEWAEFWRGIAGLPSCGISMELPGAASVGVDNAAGMRTVVDHLVTHHGHRRFAFITGPERSADARDRQQGLQSALEAHRLEVAPEHWLQGNYTSDGGRQAVRSLIDERGVAISALDVIVGANDGTARGAIDELQARGFRVPWQIAVVGFDDGIMAPLAPVPLTTVHQPLFGIGQRAVELLVASMRGGPAESAMLPTGLVIRRSCGCLEGMGHIELSAADRRRRSGQGFEVAVLERRDAIIGELRRVTQSRIIGPTPGWEGRVLTALVDELKGRSANAFRIELQQILDRVVERRGSPASMQDAISVLWRQLVPCVTADSTLRTALEGLLDGARLATFSATQRTQAAELESTELLADQVGGACIALAAATSLVEVAVVVRERFPALGVERLVVGLHPRDGSRAVVDQILSLDRGTVRTNGVRVNTAALAGEVLVPGDPGAVVAMALHSHSAVIGVVAMSVRPLRPFVCTALRAGLSAVLERLVAAQHA